MVQPVVQPVSNSRFYWVFTDFCGFLNIRFFTKFKPNFFLDHRIYRFIHGCGSCFKTLTKTIYVHICNVINLLSHRLTARTDQFNYQRIYHIRTQTVRHFFLKNIQNSIWGICVCIWAHIYLSWEMWWVENMELSSYSTTYKSTPIKF